MIKLGKQLESWWSPWAANACKLMERLTSSGFKNSQLILWGGKWRNRRLRPVHWENRRRHWSRLGGHKDGKYAAILTDLRQQAELQFKIRSPTGCYVVTKVEQLADILNLGRAFPLKLCSQFSLQKYRRSGNCINFSSVILPSLVQIIKGFGHLFVYFSSIGKSPS